MGFFCPKLFLVAYMFLNMEQRVPKMGIFDFLLGTIGYMWAPIGGGIGAELRTKDQFLRGSAGATIRDTRRLETNLHYQRQIHQGKAFLVRNSYYSDSVAVLESSKFHRRLQ